MFTVGNLRDGVAGLLSGTNVDKVTGLYKVFERAARKLAQKVDTLEETEDVGLTLYDGVYDYPISSNIFGSALVDVRPQGVTRVYLEDVQRKPMRQFDREKVSFGGNIQVSFEYKDGVPTIRVVSPRVVSQVILDSMKEDTDWVASGSIASISEDATVYYEAPQSLRFTLTGASTGVLTKTLAHTLDLTSYEDVGVTFLALRLPDGATVTDLTSVTLKIGSDSTNYDEVTVTEGFLGAWTVGDFILVAFDMSASTSTGTPDWTEIDYVQASFVHAGTLTNMRVGGLWISLPSPHRVIYQTSALFLENGVRTKTITDDDTEIVLNDAAFSLFEHEAALGVAIQTVQTKKVTELRAILYGGEGGEDRGLYAEYRVDNPSEEIRQVGTYYDN